MKKKILKSWVLNKEKKGGGTRIKEIGLKPFPYYKTFYQKKSDKFSGHPLIFSPSDYENENPLDRNKMAFEDAKNHKNFYRELIREGVYPAGSSVRVKKKRHSDSYILEMEVPKIKELSRVLQSIKNEFDADSGAENKRRIKYEMKGIQYTIDSIAREKGYKFREVTNSLGKIHIDTFPTYYEDIFGQRNYGLDSRGKVRYFDGEILIEKLQFKGRKKTEIEEYIQNLIKFSSKGKVLEKSVLGLGAVAGFVFSLFFLSSNVTGNVIGNAGASSNAVAGIITLTASFLLAFLALRK